MWDYAREFEPGTVPESDKSALFSEYDGFFGVSKLKGTHEDHGMAAAETNVVFGQGITKLFFSQQGQQMWALIFKDKYHQPPKRLKATERDMQEAADRFTDIALNEKIKFKDLWEARTRVGMLTIEEGVLSQWYVGRIVLVGDSAHKMTADLGVGANISIEDAVVLCNILHRELKDNRNHHPTKAELTSMFAEYQKDRHGRAKAFTELSGKATRMNSWDSLFRKVFATRIAPFLYTIQVKKLATAFAKGPKLDYVPVQTIDENEEGWLLAKEEEKGSSTSWLVYASVGAVATGWAISRYGLPKVLTSR